tara:strand:+ start:183 stop:908 length:726 start_codon:yes stop_codon:yes gene_type:complete
MECFLETCKKYMLVKENILKLDFTLDNFNNNINNINNYSNIKNKNNDRNLRYEKKDEKISINKDQLFWCFFIILNGNHEYEIDNSFKREKEFKIECIEKLRKIKSELKALKLRLTTIENELLNENRIGIVTLIALCFLYKKNLMYVWNRKYYEIINNIDDEIYIIINNNGDNSIFDDVNKSKKINYYKENYFLIENIEKPINSINYYCKEELFNIAQKLDIKDITNKKNKKELYEMIIQKL